MSPVTKNILTLLFFIVFYNFISMAEAATDSKQLYYKMFYQGQPDSCFANLGELNKCMIRNWQYCDIG